MRRGPTWKKCLHCGGIQRETAPQQNCGSAVWNSNNIICSCGSKYREMKPYCECENGLKRWTFKWGTQICVIRQFAGIWSKVQIKLQRNGTLRRFLTVETDRNTESGVTKMEEIRRASFSLFHHISPRSSFSLSPGTSLTTRAKSTAAIDDAMKCMDWTPILGGSHYSLNRLGVSKSPTTSLKHDVIINIEDAGNNDELVFVSSVSDPY